MPTDGRPSGAIGSGAFKWEHGRSPSQPNPKEEDKRMEAKALEFFIACVTAAGFGIAIAAFGCGIAQGLGLRSAVEGIARNPESSGKVTVTMLIGLALIESLCIYALVVALILIFAHPQATAIAKLFMK
jgi:F-type H+-transporting ATPase subunit c